ncbi:hypothetical protein HJC23_001428 [Cyclotella cryptica]|uniref:C2H2-type domain-containing protein n=1 Tax=Cyclotella cryptica TaxID=29204 RepID=A0ABD3NZY0_9STRA
MKTISYLLLGEGDFTYSLDLCRYIASLSRRVNDSRTTQSNEDEATVYSITCTGVDTLDELRSKYKDVDFVLRRIRQCSHQKQHLQLGNRNTKAERALAKTSSGEATPNIHLTTTILHGINAVQAQESENIFNDTTRQIRLRHFDHVMFHHPHLGKEDAQLHSRFLHHLFYAAGKRWLMPAGHHTCAGKTYGEAEKMEESFLESTCDPTKNRVEGGLLYLTLVNGQCDRWKCIEAAQKHGFVLIRRLPFIPPPPPIGDSFERTDTNTTYYQLRRHQSGKSFAKRRRVHQQSNVQTKEEKVTWNSGNDSETLVFGRACDYSSTVSYSTNDPPTQYSPTLGLLPWEQESNFIRSQCTGSIQLAERFIKNPQYTCSYCNKTFHEERSLKNHMVNSHPDCKEVAAWCAEKSKKKKKPRVHAHNLNNDVDVNEHQETNQQSSKDTSDSFTPSASPIVCSICENHCQDESSNLYESRTFPHLQALLDHKRAKHFGFHSHIKPDWCNANNAVHNNPNVASNEKKAGAVQEESTFFGNCSICGVSYSSEQDRTMHDLEFVPSSSSAAATVGVSNQHLKSTESASCAVNNEAHLPLEENSQPALNHKCAYCTKLFRNARDRLQHENFCSTQHFVDVKPSRLCSSV